MADKLDQKQIEHVAELAKLSFTAAELAKFTPQLTEITALFEELDQADTTGVTPMTSATDEVNVMRADAPVAISEEERQALLDNAPETAKGLIKVPAIINESEDGED